MARKHSKLQQLNGNNSFKEASVDKKSSSIEHYLKNGWLGSAYQTFIDANEAIDAWDLQEDIISGSPSQELFSSIRDP